LTVFLYNIFLWLYVIGVRIGSIWDVKARNWLKGRQRIFDNIQSAIDPQSPTVWIHCSSLGEFEQGQPVIEKIKAEFPNVKLLVTFFSPSGYETKKSFAGVDHVFYLPMDSRKNAQRFLDLVNPCLVMFIKYDYWYHYLNEIKGRKINCLLISAVFRPGQSFFTWYGQLQRSMLQSFTHIFVQNEQSKKLLETINITNCTVAGDTRFDRVAEIAGRFEPITAVEEFVGSNKCIVAGSTWKDDEDALERVFITMNDSKLKLIIAPHEIEASHLAYLEKLLPTSRRYSTMEPGQSTYSNALISNILIIDNIGMLSRLYKYADVAYVGGGFTKDGVHNVLEPAVYGKPVVFGPNYHKYKEAVDLIDCSGAKTFADENRLLQVLSSLLQNSEDYMRSCAASKKYVQENVGATTKILNYIEEKRLLTS
jgi:3-deoxy-D-manno-octulosonic-acid transferase